MKLGQQSTTDLTYSCAVLTLDSACESCPLEHMGFPLLDERVLPPGEQVSEWSSCYGSSSSSEPPWYVDVYPRPVGSNRLCVLNKTDPQNQFHECISYDQYEAMQSEFSFGNGEFDAYEVVYGPYLSDECEAQCPPTSSEVFEPRCMPLSSYDSGLHSVCGGPYYSQEQCGTGCGSSSSTSNEPTCDPHVNVVTLSDGTVFVEVVCNKSSSSSSSSSFSPGNEGNSSSSSKCQLGEPPQTTKELCPDGSVHKTTYHVPNFKECTWSPLEYVQNECDTTSSSSCSQLKRHCLYSNFDTQSLSIVFSQEDKPPPCTYRHYCLPEGCVYLCEDPSLGTPMDSCPGGDCCGPGICDKDCVANEYANCIACAMYGGSWFFEGVGWQEWHDSNCGCCCVNNGSEEQCVENVKQSRCGPDGGLGLSLACGSYDPYGFHGSNHGSNQCAYSWSAGTCKSSSSSSSSNTSSSSSSLNETKWVCHFYSGCVEDTEGFGGTTYEECQANCGQYWTCQYYGCQQNPYYFELQFGEFRTYPECTTSCVERFDCDGYNGCWSQGIGTYGLTQAECAERCVVTDRVCDPYDPCRSVYGLVSDPQSYPPPPECPITGCDRYWDCTTSGCEQSPYYSLTGYTQSACQSACVQTFYCDNYSRCQEYYSDTFSYPYPDISSCEIECINRYYCDFTTGCLSYGYGTSGQDSCSNLALTGTCYHRYYCDENNGCTDAGWGPLQQGQIESCDSTSCVKYFICVEGTGCVDKYYAQGGSIPSGGYPTREQCASSCPVSGCTNPNSPNYDEYATCDDGSCLTCCNQGLCVVDDDSPCKGPNCNLLLDGCCDAGCLPCNGTIDDCSPTFQGGFTATGCDGSTINYPSCYDCPSGS